MLQDGPHQRRQQPVQQRRKRVRKSDVEDAEVLQLVAAIKASTPPAGTNPLDSAPRTFAELPLSRYTQDGLRAAQFVTLTTIQRAALPHALAGRDILGAAKTGSGKTLAFLIPVMERLYRARWTQLDGLGALVLTPTRELALQIFQELRKVGAKHDVSAGLLIGGKNVKDEQAAVHRMNILVATPGRLLQHMDETPGFDAANLQLLVLDEADRLLDMGFAATLDAILSALPADRQTMLFSATQTKSVKDLARLSLTDPEYLAVHEASDTATPLKLQQAVAVVAAEHKMDTLWSFVKAHLATKAIVFLSTCKEVRFFSEAFRKLRPGVPLRALHGGMKQMKRMAVFQEFCQAQHMLLFATDVAGRGLDFPSVDWVVQVDCPEDTAAYIHRVGRTARYMAAGRALLMLTPKEAPGMIAALHAAKIPFKNLKINPAKQQSIGPALQSLLSKSTQLKEWAQRALVAYVRSVFLAPAKEVFDVAQLPLDAIASSWGLAAAPRMRFLRKSGGGKVVVAELGGTGGDRDPDSLHAEDDERRDPVQQDYVSSTSSDGEEGPVRKQGSWPALRSKAASLRHDSLVVTCQDDADDAGDDDFLVIKKREANAPGTTAAWSFAVALPADQSLGTALPGAKKKIKIKVGRASGRRVVFDADGNPLDPLAAVGADEGTTTEVDEEPVAQSLYVTAAEPEERFKKTAAVMKERDKEDKSRLRQLRSAVKAERKAKRKAAMAEQSTGAVLLGAEQRSDDEEASDMAAKDLVISSPVLTGPAPLSKRQRHAAPEWESAQPLFENSQLARAPLSLQQQEDLALARIDAAKHRAL